MITVRNWGNGTIELLKDGTVIETGNAVPGDYGGTGDLDDWKIGRHSAGDYYDGLIDETGVWSKALSDAEINELYTMTTNFWDQDLNNTINLTTPTNDSYLNVDSVNFNYDFLNLTGSIDNTSIYINGVLNKTNLSLISSTNQTFSISGFEDGNYTYQIRGFATGFEVNSSIYNFTIDTVQPFITTSGFTNNQKFQGTGFSNIINLTGTVDIADDNLYKVNISTQIETFYYNDSITTNELNLTLDEYIANYPPGKYTLNITATDGHTAKKIKDYRYNYGRSRTKKFDFNSPDLFLVEDFVEIEVNAGNMELIRELDRYKFDWKKTPFTKKPNSLTFTIKSDHYIDIPQNTDYAGHIIVPELNKWIDFEIEGEDKSKEDYIIQRISDSEVQITITKFNRDAAIFRSIGDLNVNTVLFDFYVYNATETFDQIVPHGHSTEYVLDLNYDYEDYDVTLPVAILQINNTNYTATLQSNSQYASRFGYEYTMPPGNQDYNLTHKWHIDYGNLTNGIVTTVDQNQSIITPVFGECIGNVTHPIAYFNYYDEITGSSIEVDNGVSLTLDDGSVTHTIADAILNESTTSICTDLDPSNATFVWNAYGTFTLEKEDYVTRVFTVDSADPLPLSNGEPYNLSLYMIPVNDSTTVTYSWRTSNFGVIDGTMKVYSCNLDGTSDLIESVPIISGTATSNIQLFTQTYRYEVIIGSSVYTDPSGWSRCHVENLESISLVVNIDDETISELIGLNSVACSLERAGNNTVTMEWGPNPAAPGVEVLGCIKAYRSTIAGPNLIYENCTSSSSYSRTVLIPTNGNEYSVTAYMKQGSYVSQCPNQVIFTSQQTGGGFFEFSALIAVFLITALFALLYAGDGEISLIATGLGLVAVYFLGILPVAWATLVSLLGILLLATVIGRYSRK
jgi:hypothetical protein